MLIERIQINIEGDSEQTKITITWAGGFTSRHRHSRTVISYAQLSRLDELIARVVQLKQTGMTLKQVAERLNQEGVASVRGRPWTNYMVSKLLTARGLYLPPARRRPERVVLGEHGWWLPDLADKLGMPRATLTYWLQSGWVRERKLPGVRGRLILWADAEEIERLERLRETRRRWSDCPYRRELTSPKSPPPNC